MKVEKRILITALHNEIITSQELRLNESISEFTMEVTGGVSSGYGIGNDGYTLFPIGVVDPVDLRIVEISEVASQFINRFNELLLLKEKLEKNKDKVMYALINVLNHCDTMDEIFNAFPPFILKIISLGNQQNFKAEPHWYTMPEEDTSLVRDFYFLSKLL